MSHPPGPPQDPYQPDPDPYGYSEPQYFPDPTTPPPPPPFPIGSSAYPPTTPYPPNQAEPSTPAPPYPTSGAPGAGYPPVSGAPGYQPTSGPPGYPAPSSGVPGYPPAPYSPASGAPGPGYPPPVPGATGYPPQLGAPVPPYQPGPPYAPTKSSGGGRSAVLVVVIIAVVLTLLCCAGLVLAMLSSDDLGSDRGFAGPATSVNPNAPLVEPGEDDPGRAVTPTTAAPAPSRTRGSGETFNMKAGDTLVITDDEGTLEVTINRFTTSNKGCRSFAPDPDEGMYLIADVTARVTKGTASINPFYFEWVGDDGSTTNGLIGALSGCGNPLGSGVDLRTGSKRSGTVVFDVADRKGVVEYQHNFKAAGSWKP